MINDKSVFWNKYKQLTPDIYSPNELLELFPEHTEFIHKERLRINQLIEFEKHIAEDNIAVGTDEAGRGPLAGPVVAAAVKFTEPVFIPFVNDSKKLSAIQRHYLFFIIKKSAQISISVIQPFEIDRINILKASLKAMNGAIERIFNTGCCAIIDGNKKIPDFYGKQNTVIKGDCKCFSVACASIVAKVTRDSLMEQLAKVYPGYGFDSNKGYGTAKHLEAISKLGLIEGVHRKSFCEKFLFPIVKTYEQLAIC